ncbi:IclR family transcriptional regulator [Streptomyces sp. NPDC046862]|uniref:IclR family transcriptional regulator n=1 Tax=Streptomyces sp. NPDC046862 TaxID=3154603 RepID=UPI0034522B64
MARTDRSAVAKALDLLKALADAEGPQRLTELAESVGLHRATAHRSLAELADRNFVLRDENDRYILGWAFLRMTQSPGARHSLAELSRPVLNRLAIETDRIAGIEVLESGGCRVIETVRSPRYQRFRGFSGELFEPWRSASGLTLLAFATPGEQRTFLDTAAAAGIDIDNWAEQLQMIRDSGYAHSSGQLDPLTADVAVPVFGAGDQCRAVISVTGLAQDINEDGAPQFAAAAASAAQSLQRLMEQNDVPAAQPR